MEAMLMLRKWWSGHVSCMPDTQIPKELSEGKRDRGAPRKCWKDQLKGHLTQVGINPKNWEQLLENHAAWWSTTRKVAQDFEITRREAAEERRRWQKDAQEQDPTGPSFLCPWCPRICLSRIGLISHLRACLPWQDLPTIDPWLWRNCHYHHQWYYGKAVCVVLEIQFLRSCGNSMCPLEFPHYNAFYSERITWLLENIKRCYTTAQMGMHLVSMTN